MPRGGSKKGEHRGSAKRAAKQAAGTVAKRGRGRPAGSWDKHTLEVENEIARIVNPLTFGNLFPKEQMLMAMREFMDEFAEYKAMENTERAAVPLDDGNLRRAAYFRARAREALIVATDISYKAAPYLHPRLAALAMVPNENDNPRGIVQEMLNEIDRRSREAKLISATANDDSQVDDEEDVA